jgi:hypothetical protein
LMRLGVHNGIQLYMRSRCHSVMIHFPRKIFVSISTTRTNWSRG